jgi:hypothetical protein
MALGTAKIGLLRSATLFALWLGAVGAVSTANAQLLYSFESGLEGWGPSLFGGSDLISVTQSTLGPTDGTHSMAVERGNAIGDTQAFSWDVNRTVTAGDTPALYSIFQTVAADPTRYSLDFDVTITPESFADVTSIGPFFIISISANGSAAGENNFNQLLNLIPVSGSVNENLIGADGGGNPVPKLGTHHYSVPLTDALGGTGLYFVPDSSYYQVNLGSNLQNTLFQNGPNGEGAVYFVDNVRFRELPETVEQVLFSWETPDDAGTPEVNEQYEGWVEGFHPGHVHSLVPTGATHGSTALQIDRTSAEGNFAWGSQFLISSDTDPGPGETIDPARQAIIDQLSDDIMGAQSVAFDVTYEFQDHFPIPAPEWTKFGVHFTDETGVQYQAEQPGFIPGPFPGNPQTTITIEIPLTSFVGFQNGIPLLDIGFAEGTNFFRIALSTNTLGSQIYQIDNFRLISLADAGLLGDFNEDGKVDTADYVTWRKSGNNPLPNDDGVATEAARYDLWRAHFGEVAQGGGSSLAAVPEPASMALVFVAAVAALFVRNRRG